MSRIPTFFTGFVLGGVLVYVALHYHVVRADDGVHLVPKMSSDFSQSYVDIRDFGILEWNENRALAAAIVRADKEHLLKEMTSSPLRRTLDGVLESLSGSRG